MTAYDGLNNACIFDFETLSQEQTNGVVLSMAMTNFAESRFTSDIPYTFEELVMIGGKYETPAHSLKVYHGDLI
jgi:hypothetical protein